MLPYQGNTGGGSYIRHPTNQPSRQMSVGRTYFVTSTANVNQQMSIPQSVNHAYHNQPYVEVAPIEYQHIQQVHNPSTNVVGNMPGFINTGVVPYENCMVQHISPHTAGVTSPYVPAGNINFSPQDSHINSQVSVPNQMVPYHVPPSTPNTNVSYLSNPTHLNNIQSPPTHQEIQQEKPKKNELEVPIEDTVKRGDLRSRVRDKLYDIEKLSKISGLRNNYYKGVVSFIEQPSHVDKFPSSQDFDDAMKTILPCIPKESAFYSIMKVEIEFLIRTITENGKIVRNYAPGKNSKWDKSNGTNPQENKKRSSEDSSKEDRMVSFKLDNQERSFENRRNRGYDNHHYNNDRNDRIQRPSWNNGNGGRGGRGEHYNNRNHHTGGRGYGNHNTRHNSPANMFGPGLVPMESGTNSRNHYSSRNDWSNSSSNSHKKSWSSYSHNDKEKRYGNSSQQKKGWSSSSENIPTVGWGKTADQQKGWSSSSENIPTVGWGKTADQQKGNPSVGWKTTPTIPPPPIHAHPNTAFPPPPIHPPPPTRKQDESIITVPDNGKGVDLTSKSNDRHVINLNTLF